MITLDAVYSSVLPNGYEGWESVPLWALHYDCFLGDIHFCVERVDFSTHWGWVPVLDFALVLSSMLNALQRGEESVFEFTESSHALRISRDGDIAAVSASYVKVASRAHFAELHSVVNEFLSSLEEDLLKSCCGIEKNSQLQDSIVRARRIS